MADKVTLEAEIKSNVGKVANDVEKLDKGLKKADGGVKKLGVGFKTLAKASGIVFLLNKAFEIFQEVVGKNQTVVDAFDTAMNSLSIAFNDLFGFISNNVGKVIDWFKAIFENPKQSLIDFGTAIKENLIERFNSVLDTLGHLAKAIGHLFKGEFAEAKDEAINAGKEMVDVWTGVDDSVDKVTATVKKAITAVVDYTKSTIEQGKAMTDANKAADLAAVKFAKLNAQFLKDAELQRQIRDDETKTFAERIKANEDLSKVLEKQQKLQREQLDTQERAAQLQFNMTKNDEDFIALQEAKIAKLELEETITGQLSEQKTNQVSLEKELREVTAQTILEGMSEREREMAQLKVDYDEKIRMAKLAGQKTTAIEAQFAKQKAKIAKEQTNEQLEAFSGLAGALSSLAGESKELAIAQAIIDTYVGANKAFGQGGVTGFVSAAAIIASGLANVKTIMEQDVGSGGGGGGMGAAAAPPAPEMMSGSFDLAGGVKPEPVQAYVVSDDVTANQDKLAAIRRRATI